MQRVVPEPNRRLGTAMSVAENTQTGRIQQKITGRLRLKPEPARHEHAKQMATRKEEHVAFDGADALDDRIGPDCDLARRFAPGTAVAKQIPVRPLGTDFGRTHTFVGAIIPFAQVWIDVSGCFESCEFARSRRA